MTPQQQTANACLFCCSLEHKKACFLARKRFPQSKQEVRVSLFLIATKKEKLPSWDAVCAGLRVELIFCLDTPLWKYGITAPGSTSPSFCTVINFSCPCVTASAGESVWSLEHPAGSVKQGGREARLKGLSLFKSRGEESKGRSESPATENLPGRAVL